MKTFWIGVSISIVLLAGIFAARLGPRAARAAELKRELRSLAGTLEAARPGTPSREDIGGWRRYGNDATKATREITAFYAERDRRFERWFPDLTIGRNGAPSRDAFVTRHRDETRMLEDALRRASVRVGPRNDDRAPGFNWERLTITELDDVGRADEPAVLHRVQKRFWARKRIADLALEGRVRIGRIVDFRFFERLHDRIRVDAPLGGGSERVVWPGLGGELQPGLPRDFQETPLPGGLGRTFTFGAVLELPLSEVPRAVRDLLNPDPGMLLSVIGSHVTLGEPLNGIRIPVEKGEDQEFERLAREFKLKNKPRDVLLVLTCRILDVELPGSR